MPTADSAAALKTRANMSLNSPGRYGLRPHYGGPKRHFYHCQAQAAIGLWPPGATPDDPAPGPSGTLGTVPGSSGHSLRQADDQEERLHQLARLDVLAEGLDEDRLDVARAIDSAERGVDRQAERVVAVRN